MRVRASCYRVASEQRRSMVWPSSEKLDGVFRYALPYCQCRENDLAVAPVRLRAVRNLCRSIVLRLGLLDSIFRLANCNSFGMYHTQTVEPQMILMVVVEYPCWS